MDLVRPLPQVPRTGRATEVLPRILVTTCAETLRKAKRKPNACQTRARTLPVRRSHNKAKPIASFSKALIQEDNLAKLEFPKTVLAPGGDAAVNDVGLALKSYESSMAEKDVLASLTSLCEDSFLLDPLEPSRRESLESQYVVRTPLRSFRAQQAYCRSLMSSRNESRLNTPKDSRGEESSDMHWQRRLDELQRSFAVSAREVAAKLQELRRRPVGDYHIDVPDTADVESTPSKTPSSANHSFLSDVPPPMAPRPRRSTVSDRSTPALKAVGLRMPNLDELRESYASAGLPVIPAKPPEPFMHSELPDTKASHEELQRAVKRLNAMRWFCRLPPVHLDEEETELCNYLSEALLMRQPVFLSESHALARRFSDLGLQLGGFMAQGDYTLMLYKESSLVSAMDLGVLCSHTAGWSYASAPAPGVDDVAPGLEEVLQRALRHRTANPWEMEGRCSKKLTGHFTVQNLPEPLAGFRSMWEITEAARSEGKAKPLLSPRAECSSPVRPWTNQSMRSRPGTVGTISSCAPTQERRPNTSSGRVRQVMWGSTESAKRKEWSRATNLSWGDRSKTVMLRRQLLSPKLHNIGGSRRGQTIVLRMVPSADVVKEEPDFVIFPPEGVCPMELLSGCRLPTWTIMPNSGRYQSSQSLQVRMWRVRLERPEGEHAARLPADPPYEALRLEELPLSFLTCDCSAEGNSFCILFRPLLARICDGDQFEVELRGLRGSDERHHFFHEFLPFSELEWQEHSFLKELETFCQCFDERTFEAPPKLHRSFSPLPVGVPELRPLSHQFKSIGIGDLETCRTRMSLWKDFKTDETELAMYFYCPGVAAFDACLKLQRSDGKIKVERATMVVNVQDRFLVRVKLPCSVSKYELSFQLSSRQRPEKMVEHPLKYAIRSLESRSYPVAIVEDPPNPKYQRFGFCPVPCVAQLLGITICGPIEYGLQPGTLYFLVHVQPEHLKDEAGPEPLGLPLPTQLFRHLHAEHEQAERSALETQAILEKDPFFTEQLEPDERMQEMLHRRTFQNTQRMKLHRPSAAMMDPAVNVVRRLHHGLECHLADRIQDLPSTIQFDLVVRDRSQQERFVQRLQRKVDYPEFFQGVMHLSDRDHDARIELYYRPQEPHRSPLKIGEWNVSQDAAD